MFFSALISRYQPDGTLSVDLSDQGGPIVGYGPFAAGMPWFRRTSGGWVETAYDWGARLVNPAHESRKDLPVLRYLGPWPRDLIRKDVFQCQAIMDVLEAGPVLLSWPRARRGRGQRVGFAAQSWRASFKRLRATFGAVSGSWTSSGSGSAWGPSCVCERPACRCPSI
ncbi:hypothetical protein CKO25_19755 [Thiocapsa imhoffii]|uniref:Uncharacterized protein n=1 Tax=Thiocapsa imhoffii TaxID=382777 RepID=A0A9X0WLM7_9GAMM|nr:hypothetical protein [Thiocapsa imhoffii]